MNLLNNLKNTKDLNTKIKWILSQSKPIIPFLVFTIIINVIFSLIGVYNALISKSLIDSAIAGETSNVIKWLIVMATIMIGKLLINPITSFFSTHASMKLTYAMQTELYDHIIRSEWLEQNKIHSISQLTRITSDVGTINSTLLSIIPGIISLSVTLVASFSTLIYLAPSIALCAILVGPFLLIISKLFASKLKEIYKQIQEEDVKYRSFIQESILNIMIVKTFCMENINMRKLKTIQANKYHLAMKNTKLGILSGTSMSFCSSLAYFIIFCWGALNISTGTGTYGTFTAMLQLYSNIQSPFSSLAGMFPSLVSALAATERLMEIENIASEPVSSSPILLKESPIIEFRNISFSYTPHTPIIKNIQITLYPGETIALVGPSGQGKTTIIRLLLALIHPDHGKILLHTSEHSTELTSAHRELISYVPQGNTLFSGTILDNLLYGKPDASEAEIAEALELACASQFVSQLQDGLYTQINEKGSGISEGQAQRLAIARALIRKRPILILDEATSSLDGETELQVLESIQNLPYKPTCIIITHRPSALAICDRVFCLKKGILTETEVTSPPSTAIV